MNRVLTGSTLTQPKQYLLTESRVIMTYIRLAFLPINQNIDYDYSISKSIFEMPVLLSLLCLSMVFYWAKCLFQNYRLVSFSICWFFLTLMPESSFLSSMDVIYEHRLYLPMVGFSMFLVCGLYYLGGKHAFKMMLMVLVFIAVNSCFTYQRNKVWLNELSLWNDAVLKSPHKARPYNNRGSAWGNQGKFVQAMLDFNKAIELKPDYADAYYDRGNIYNHQGDKARAIAEYNKAILLDPRRSEVYNNRGQVEYAQGNFTQAMSDFSKAIKVNPNYLVAYRNRGLAYFNQGELTQAFSDINKAIEIYPENAESYYIRAIIYFKFKEYSKAWDDVHKAQALGSWVDPRFIRDLKKVLESHE